MSVTALTLALPWLPRGSRDQRCAVLAVTVACRSVCTVVHSPRQSILNWFEELLVEITVERQLWRAEVDRLALADLQYRRLLEPSDSESVESFGSVQSRFIIAVLKWTGTILSATIHPFAVLLS